MNKNSLNKVILCGRLGKDPEQRQTPGGLAIASFSLATTDSKRETNGTYTDTTEWHNCVAFGKQAEYISKYIGKGRLVIIEGRLKTSSWEKDGINRYKTDIIVDTITPLDKAVLTGDNQNPTQTHQQGQKVPSEANPTRLSKDNEELPF